MSNKPIDNKPELSETRRTFIKQSAAVWGTTLLAGFGAPSIAMAQSTKLETTKVKLGFIALSDAAPLFIAEEKGFFKKHGMTDVEVLKQSSWGTTRDNLVLGSAGNGIDGAHLLTPMAYLLTTGAITTNNIPVPMSILCRLNLDGQGISVSNEYKDLKVGTNASEFKAALAAKKGGGKAVNAAMTFPGGTHDLWLRYWMASAGIDPNASVSTVVVPPPQMVANMKVGSMDTFCVGEPWNLQLIHQKIGYSALTTGELWNNHPEKALSLRADYVQANPNATKALLKAVMEAQIFCDDPVNKDEVARVCSQRKWINAPVGDIIERIKGDFDYGTGRIESNSKHLMKYWRNQASYPFQSHDLWFITENQRWGYLPSKLDTNALIKKVNREDIWRVAAKELGIAAKDIPTSTSRGVEKFFDGKVFDPKNPKAYLDSLAIKAMKA